MVGGYPQLDEQKVSAYCKVDEQKLCVPAPSLADNLQILIGTSQMAREDTALVSRIAGFSGKGEREVYMRLGYGDAGEEANRVMHIAFRGGVAVGWCSSTPGCGWGGRNGGHWGALAVDPLAQGQGVASALVKAAERRLLDAGCDSVQIEYRYTVGDPEKERLYAWYEGKLGFDGGLRRSGFRCCHKELSEATFQAQHEKGSPSTHLRFEAGPNNCSEAKRVRAWSASSSYSSSSSSTDI